MKVFLGGTINGSMWRDEFIKKLKIEYFNPVVPEWNEKAYQEELYERSHCDFCLYVITPKMSGFYSIAEVVDDSYKRPGKTIFCILTKDEDKRFSDYQLKSLRAVGRIVVKNGATWLDSLDEIIDYLNKQSMVKDF